MNPLEQNLRYLKIQFFMKYKLPREVILRTDAFSLLDCGGNSVPGTLGFGKNSAKILASIIIIRGNKPFPSSGPPKILESIEDEDSIYKYKTDL